MEKLPMSSLMSIMPLGLAVGPSLSCGGALGLWWVGLPLEKGTELPRGQGLQQDPANHTEEAANQNAAILPPLFLRFACQAQSRSQQNLSVQTEGHRVRAARTIQTGTELLLGPTDPDPATDENSEMGHATQRGELLSLGEKTSGQTVEKDERHKMAATETEKCMLLKERECEGHKMPDTNKNDAKNKTQRRIMPKKVINKEVLIEQCILEEHIKADAETDISLDQAKCEEHKMGALDKAQRLRGEKEIRCESETAPPTVRCSSRLASKPRLVHRLSNRVTSPVCKPASSVRRQQQQQQEREENTEAEQVIEGITVETKGVGVTVETTGDGVTVDTTGEVQIKVREMEIKGVSVETTGGRERRHRCATCGKSFFQKGHLKKHEFIHSNRKPFSCDQCERRYSSVESFRAHQLSHRGERPFSCPFCVKSYGLKRDLKEHLVLHSGLRPFKCSDCGKAFARRPSLRIHRLHHCVSRTSRPVSKVQCSVCNKLLANAGSLKNHMKIHTGDRPHSCQYCGKSFSQKGNLAAHVRAHSGERPFTCTACGRSFSQRAELQRHQQVHTGTAFLCSSCGKVLRDAQTLRAHEALHSGARAHCCPLCPKGYVSATKLRRHLRSTHSTEKPFRCHCGAAYSLQQSLTRHQALHRLDEGGPGPQHRRPIRGRPRGERGQPSKHYEETLQPVEEHVEGVGLVEVMMSSQEAELLIVQEVAATVEINTG